MSRSRWMLATAIALLACLLAAGPASAAKKATSAQAAALAKAVFASPMAGEDPGFKARYRVIDAKISTVSRAWATATVAPKPRYRDSLQGGYVVAVQPAGTKQWVVVDFGTALVGCGIAPNSVLADLLGIKTAAPICPKGTGAE